MADRQIERKVKGITLRFLIVSAVFLLALLTFSIIADEMVVENENALDFAVFQKLAAFTSPPLTHFMLFVTFFGSAYFLLPAYSVLILYFLFTRQRRWVLDVAAVGLSSAILLFSLKDLFHRQRPLTPLVRKVAGFSFPSGHSFSSFTFFGLLIYMIWHLDWKPGWRWVLTVVFFGAACVVAFSRVYLRVHYASDVIAGFCLCVVWLTISLWLLNRYNKKLS